MADKMRFRRNGGLNASVTMKTPRIKKQSSGVYVSPNPQLQPLAAPQKGVLPLLPATQEPVSVVPIRQSFHAFVESLSAFLTHNGGTVSFRAQLAQQATELDYLFSSFFQCTSKVPSIHSAVSRTLPFAKGWQSLVLSLLQVRTTGPQAIRQSIETHFATVSGSLESVLKNGVKGNLHDTSFRNCRSLQGQLVVIKKNTVAFLDHPGNVTEMKRLETLLKNFSRGLNDTFTREFSQCGIAQNEVVRLRTRSYTACCDIIQQMKAACLFDSDMVKLIGCIRDFQEFLKELYPKFNIPLSYIVPLNFGEGTGEVVIEEEEVTERMPVEEPSFEFDESMALVEFVLECQSNAELIGSSLGEFFRILSEKAQALQSDFDDEVRRRRDLEMQEQAKSVAAAQSTEELNRCRSTYENTVKSLEMQMKVLERRVVDLRQGLFDVLMVLGGKSSRDVTDEVLMASALEACTNRLATECEGCRKKDKEKEELQKQVFEREATIRELKNTVKDFQNYKTVVAETCGDLSLVKVLREREDKLKEILHVENDMIVPETDRIVKEYETALEDLRGVVGGDSLVQMTRNVCSSVLDTKETLMSVLDDKTEGDLKDLAQIVVDMAKNHEDVEHVHNILDEISLCKGCDLNTHAQICVDQYKGAVNGNAQYRRVLEVLQIRNGQDLFTVLDQRMNNYKLFLSKVSDNISKITGSKAEQTESFVFAELASISNQMKLNHDSLVNLQRTCSSVETCLARLCGVTLGKKPITESIEMLLKSLEQQKAPSLMQIEKRLADILKVERVPENDATKRVMDLLDLVSVRINDTRKGLETIASATIKNGSFEKVDTKTLVTRILKALTPPKPAVSNNLQGIDKMFTDVFALVPVTSRTDYKEYIPEICAAFCTLHNSVMALKPFASTLNNIFTQFDCKFTSFHPGSESYKFLRSQVFALHTSLNSLVPSKINSLVFLVLSRFIALFSSFMTAISSASFDPSSEKMQEEFFRLEQENQKHA